MQGRTSPTCARPPPRGWQTDDGQPGHACYSAAQIVDQNSAGPEQGDEGARIILKDQPAPQTLPPPYTGQPAP